MLVEFFFTVDEASDHLLCVAVHCGQFHVEVDRGLLRSAGDIHDAVDTDIVGVETAAELEVCQGDAIDDIQRFQVKSSVVGITSKADAPTFLKLKVFFHDILDG